MKQQKQVSDYSDRELLERSAMNAKASADAAKWCKRFIVITGVLYFILWVISR